MIKKRLEKVLQWLTLCILLFAVSSSEPNAVLARARKRDKPQAKEIITKFLSSVKLVKKAYDFDHDGDGIIDLTVYPLKTENPDLKTKYITLEEAINKKQVILRENPGIIPRSDPPSSYSIFAQYSGVGYGRSYYPRGGMMGGGYQSRGFSRGGMMGRGYGGGYRGYGGGYRGYSNFGDKSEEMSFGKEIKKEINFEDTEFAKSQYSQNIEDLKVKRDRTEKLEAKIDVLCIEKWRLIEESRMRGEPEFFSYAGMASPFVRKELILFPNQKNIHKIIAKELRRLNIYSRTSALTDVFKDKDIKEVIDYYVINSKYILKEKENKDISGMIIKTGSGKILCVDIYSSPDLFKKMFPQLMQSAALVVYSGERARRDDDVEKFLSKLKKVEKLRKEKTETTTETYRLCLPKIISEALLDSDKNGLRVVHLEAYPRS